MDPSYKEIIRGIIKTYTDSGVIWKKTETAHFGYLHLKKRQKRQDLPHDWILEDYNILIMNIINKSSTNVHLYFRHEFTQEYFIFVDDTWMIIIGDNKVMETAMKGNPANYMSNNPGYKYLGKIRDVFK